MKEKKDKSISACENRTICMPKSSDEGENRVRKDRATRDNLFFKTLDYSWRERWETSERKKEDGIKVSSIRLGIVS
jgi:hypothetical protein